MFDAPAHGRRRFPSAVCVRRRGFSRNQRLRTAAPGSATLGDRPFGALSARGVASIGGLRRSTVLADGGSGTIRRSDPEANHGGCRVPAKNGRAQKIIDALGAVPAPLKNEEQADAFTDAVAMLQDAPKSVHSSLLRPASRELVRVIGATLSAPRPNRFSDALLIGLKYCAYTGTRESLDVIIRAVRLPLDPGGYFWTMVLAPFGEGHRDAGRLMAALSRKIPEGFIGVCVLDAANEACREHGLKKHPFDSGAGVARLKKYLAGKEYSYAVSACAAIPFLSKARRGPLFKMGRAHRDIGVRLEAAWAAAKLGDASAVQQLVDACLDRDMSMRARHYLKELKLGAKIPKAAKEPDFAAMCEMCDWLSHPNEYGEPPTTIRLMDKRTIYWPPAKKERELRLFAFEYAKSKHRPKKDTGVGMVGSVTWAFFDETKPTMKPEDLYGMHCCFELESSDDPRAPRKRSGKAGWKLIRQRA